MRTTEHTGLAADLVPYPDDQVERYRGEGLWGERTIGEEFHETARAFPDDLAVLGPDGSLTYRELDRRTDLIAAGLAGAGLRPGERVLVQVTNHANAVVAWYALLKAGLVPIATLVHHRRHELTEVARLANAAAHLIEPDYVSHDLVALAREVAQAEPGLRILLTLNAVADVPGAHSLESLAAGSADAAAARAVVQRIQDGLDPNDVAVLQLSGGTTSTPKLIPRLHAEYWYNARAYAAAIGLRQGGQVAHLLPIAHNAGVVCAMHAAHAVGASLAISPHDEVIFTEVAQRGRITHMLMSPPMGLSVLTNDDLRTALTGSMQALTWVLGAPPPELVELFETDRCHFTQMFGMGEGLCMFTGVDVPLDLRRRAVGTPISALDEVRVYEPGTENLVEPGEQGELCCRGPYTIRGYFRSPERNAEAFTADGFYRTGDIVVELPSPNGRRYFALADRIKDVINRGGEKVNAGEVEELLLRHDAIRQAAVVAMPDPTLGERACAFLVLVPGADPVTLRDVATFLTAQGVAKFKFPERIEIRDSLPMTSVTKVKKVALREEIARLLEQEGA